MESAHSSNYYLVDKTIKIWICRCIYIVKRAVIGGLAS